MLHFSFVTLLLIFRLFNFFFSRKFGNAQGVSLVLHLVITQRAGEIALW